MVLSDEQTQFFETNGYLVLDNFFNQTETDDFKKALKVLVQNHLKKASKKRPEINPSDFEGKEFHEGILKLEEIDHTHVMDIYDTICNTPAFLRITGKKEISECINQLFDRNLISPVYVDQSRCRMDLPLDPNQKACGWHQEVFYYIPKSNFFQTWAPLIEDATVENGTIEVCIGSHKKIAKQASAIDEDVHYKYIVDEEEVKKYEQVLMEMKVGQLLIFNSRLIHRSGKNTSNQVRYSLVGIYHNVDNENFFPPRMIVENKHEIMRNYFDEVF